MSFKLKSLITVLAVALAAPAVMAETKAEKAEKAEKADKTEKGSKAGASGVTVNGVAIPKAFIDALTRDAQANGQAPSAEMDKAIKDELVTREVLAQAAKKKGIDKNPTIATQMEMARQAVLIRAFFDDYVKSTPIGDPQLKAIYDQGIAAAGDKEYKVRHILVKTEDEAKTIIANLKRGDSFETLAKAKSEDPGSKDNGGDLDWTTPGRFVPEFGAAMKLLQKGQTTDVPVKTQYGFHIIRLDDVRPLKLPTFEEAKDNLKKNAQQELVQRLIQSLREKAEIKGL